jgi:alkylated DNA repair dioxygenase AlkB
MSWQESLFDVPVPGWGALAAPSDRARDAAPPGALAFDGVRRLYLDDASWIDVAPGWMPGHAALFDELLESAPWQQRERQMYERRVLEPRLVAAWSAGELATLADGVRAVRAAVGERYAVDFDSVLVNLYRDGRDGVAWHGDRVHHRLDRTVVVTVALGERRRFQLRRGTSGAASLTLASGEGDLIVMGGRCQHDWQHTVPKSRAAGARMSITLRHSAPLTA